MIELLEHNRVRHAGVRGGLLPGAGRHRGGPAEATPHGAGSRAATVAYAGTAREVRVAPGGPVTSRDLAP
ncbi:hypothetical protein [Streptomyces sp. NPDC003456]|uniref:hypothetical protein n=1 Tax=Streptomyces sp. NPDC003456 TaxID=3364683 RepID=UPI00367441AA